MKILIQWTSKDPKDRIEIDSTEWVNLPKKLEPVGGEVIDNVSGWSYGAVKHTSRSDNL